MVILNFSDFLIISLKRIFNLYEIQSFCNNNVWNESDNTRNYGNLRKKYLNDKLESYIDDHPRNLLVEIEYAYNGP